MLDRQSAFALLQEHTSNPSLIKHALAVEACMRAYAGSYGEDVEKWGIVGLLHDFDYQRFPNPPDHPEKGAVILEQRGYPEDVIYAIKSHASWTGCPRRHLMDKVLFACDELSGFMTAVTLVRPDRKIEGPAAEVGQEKAEGQSLCPFGEPGGHPHRRLRPGGGAE